MLSEICSMFNERKIRTTSLIWNDLCQAIIFDYFFSFLHFFKTLPGAGDFDDESVWYSWIRPPLADQSRHWYSPSWVYAFYKREFGSKAAYRMRRSHITLIVPAPVSANLISNFQVSKNNFGGGAMKNNFPITPPFSFFLSHILLMLTI